MSGKNIRTSLFGYVAGIIGLAAVILLAWIGPKRYFDWQESRREGEISLSYREDIQFLDAASLDLAGRMKLLSESDYIDWIEYGYSTVDVEGKINEIKENVQLWADCHLLPEMAIKSIDSKYLNIVRDYALMINGNTFLPLCLFHFDYWPGQENFNLHMTVVMDAEKNIMYYASIVGTGMEDYYSEIMGYSSVDELDQIFDSYDFQSYGEFEKVILANGDEKLREEMANYDFASACGASSAEVVSSALGLELDAKLEFDNFTGYAGRKLAGSDYYDTGLAVSFGNPPNEWYVGMILEQEGMGEYIFSLEELIAEEIVDSSYLPEEPGLNEEYDKSQDAPVAVESGG